MIAVTLFAFYSHEKGLRRQFIDHLSSEKANERLNAEQGTLTSLLSQSIPPFALPEIVAWLATTRAAPISHAYPRAIVGFVRAPAVVHGLDTGRQMFNNLTNLVNAYETVLSHSAFTGRIIKIKTIGDIMLLVAGHRFRADASLSTSRQSSQNSTPRAQYTPRHDLAAAAPNERGSTPPLASIALSIQRDSSSEQKDIALLSCFGHAVSRLVTANLNQPLAMGIHLGAVAAAVVGDTRLIFDVFGDTVNTAARVMANCGGEGVWLSSWTCNLLRPQRTSSDDSEPTITIATDVGKATLRLGAEVFKDMKGKGEVSISRVVDAELTEWLPPTSSDGATAKEGSNNPLTHTTIALADV